MRVVYFILLVILVAAIAVFAVQNQESLTVRFLDYSISSPMSLVIAAGYVLGMVSGWTVLGLLKRSLHRAAARPKT